MRVSIILVVATLAAGRPAVSQDHAHPAPAGVPTQPGQDAYGAIAEIVALLEADPATDWTRVDLEALRRHLIDMNTVTLRSVVRHTPVEGGVSMDVTGAGADADAVRRMLTAHAPTLDALPDLVASVTAITGGVRFVVRAERAGDAATARRIRGLGFIGLLTVGAHHAPHHLALARGTPPAGHVH